MALNSSGPISLAGTITGQSIELELLGNGTTQISLNDAAVRTLAGVPSGAITMPTNFYGKSSVYDTTLYVNQTDMNLRTWALSNGWDGVATLEVTIYSNIQITASSTSNAAMTISGSFPNGVTLTNNGLILGKGGTGGTGGSGSGGAGGGGASGGTGLSVSSACTIYNYNTIGGGGGGGGGGAPTAVLYGAGGGGGGGAGFGVGGSRGDTRAGPNGASNGSTGGATTGGAGGSGWGATGRGASAGGNGGTGGGLGSDGGSGTRSADGTYGGYGGGSAGNAVVGNSLITWAATGTRLGPIS